MYFQDRKSQRGFEYEVVKRKKGRAIHLRIQKNGSVVVSLPPTGRWFSVSIDVEKFLQERTDFIFTVLDKYERLSKKYPDLYNFTPEHYKFYRQEAGEMIKSKVDYFARRYGFRYNTISIRNQATRLGSCSSKGNLNFNYKIIFLAPEEMDYIIVHELCHLREPNHSSRFWSEVAKIIPDYKIVKKGLKLKE